MSVVHIKQKVWDKYRDIISQFMDNSTAKKPIRWLRYLNQPSLFGEDDLQYVVAELNVLISDNSYRTWPINQTTTTGEIDNQNLSIWVSKRYLEDNNLLNSHGYFDFNRASDRFIINGIIYRSSGDLEASQANDDELLFMLVLKRDDDEKLYNKLVTLFPDLLPFGLS